jgi:hypothetical protein
MWWHRFAVFATLLSFFSPLSSLFAQDSLQATLVATLDVMNEIEDMAVDSPYVYIVATFGFHVTDVSDEANPHEIAHLDLPDPVYAIALSGNHAYVACGGSISAFDIANPHNPQGLGSLQGEETDYRYLAVSEGLLCATGGDYPGSVYVFDATDPSELVLLDTIPDMYTGPLALRDSLLYLSHGNEQNSGLRIYDLHNPSEPVQIGALDSVRSIGSFAIWEESLTAVTGGNPYNI